MAARTGKPALPRAGAASSKQALIDAGVALFSRNGYDATGVQEIVERAGLTKGSFYYAFPSKDDLLRHIQDTFIDSCLAAMDQVIAQGHPPQAAFAGAIDWLINLVRDRHDELSIFFQESRHLSQPLFAEVRAKRELFERQFTALLKDGQDAGIFRPVPARITAFGVIGMCAWAYHWMRTDAGPTEEISKVYADVLLNGLFEPGYSAAS